MSVSFSAQPSYSPHSPASVASTFGSKAAGDGTGQQQEADRDSSSVANNSLKQRLANANAAKEKARETFARKVLAKMEEQCGEVKIGTVSHFHSAVCEVGMLWELDDFKQFVEVRGYHEGGVITAELMMEVIAAFCAEENQQANERQGEERAEEDALVQTFEAIGGTYDPPTASGTIPLIALFDAVHEYALDVDLEALIEIAEAKVNLSVTSVSSPMFPPPPLRAADSSDRFSSKPVTPKVPEPVFDTIDFEGFKKLIFALEKKENEYRQIKVDPKVEALKRLDAIEKSTLDVRLALSKMVVESSDSSSDEGDETKSIPGAGDSQEGTNSESAPTGVNLNLDAEMEAFEEEMRRKQGKKVALSRYMSTLGNRPERKEFSAEDVFGADEDDDQNLLRKKSTRRRLVQRKKTILERFREVERKLKAVSKQRAKAALAHCPYRQHRTDEEIGALAAAAVGTEYEDSLGEAFGMISPLRERQQHTHDTYYYEHSTHRARPRLVQADEDTILVERPPLGSLLPEVSPPRSTPSPSLHHHNRAAGGGGGGALPVVSSTTKNLQHTIDTVCSPARRERKVSISRSVSPITSAFAALQSTMLPTARKSPATSKQGTPPLSPRSPASVVSVSRDLRGGMNTVEIHSPQLIRWVQGGKIRFEKEGEEKKKKKSMKKKR